MKKLSRRDFVVRGVGAAALSVAPIPFFGMFRDAIAQDPEPHFFVHLVFESGWDTSLLFDARSKEMTQAGKIHRYAGADPILWKDHNDQDVLVSPFVEPLKKYRDDFSVIRGVHMLTTFDGHQQNLNMLLTGNPFGGESFIPHLNEIRGKHMTSLDMLQIGFLFATQSNSSNSISLNPTSSKALVDKFKDLNLNQTDPTFRFLKQRADELGKGSGLFSHGAKLLSQALGGSSELLEKLKLVQMPAPPTPPTPPMNPDPNEGDEEMPMQPDPLAQRRVEFRQQLDLMGEYLKRHVSKSVMISPNAFLDTHDSNSAKEQPGVYKRMIQDMGDLIQYLKDTPYDSTRSLYDLTTFMVSSEFSRTMRQQNRSMDSTGTDHNALSNHFIVGGKGIKTGMLIGATDLETPTEVASKAHLRFDSNQLRAMGRPFDIKTLKYSMDRPDDYKAEDYLQCGSLVNTFYSLFGAPKSQYRSLGRNLGECPVIDGILV